jgi:hypothetical protein
MKIFWLSFSLLTMTISPASSQGDFRSSWPCDEYLAACKGLYPKQAAYCQRMYDAAVKSGGRWTAVDASGRPQGQVLFFCMP